MIKKFQLMSPIETLRLALFLILLLGMLGSGVELLLLNHTEEWRQWIPLALLLLGVIVSGWHGLRATGLTVRVLRAVCIAFVVSGLAGMYFHYLGSVEFKLESNPGLSGWGLFWQAIHSKTPPLLAPGMMVQLGLLGLVYTYRHPMLTAAKNENPMKQGV